MKNTELELGVPTLPKAKQFSFPAQFASRDSVKVVFDVGAHRGGYARQYMRLYNKAQIYAFEPAPWNLSVLEHAEWRDRERVHIIPVALSDREGTEVLHRFSKEGTESLLPATRKFLEFARVSETDSAQVPVTTLDRFCAERDIEQVGLMKMDIQGMELAALRGASGMLKGKRIKVLFIELQFWPYYEGQCWAGEVIEYLAGFGYRLECLIGPHGKEGALAHANGLFVIEGEW